MEKDDKFHQVGTQMRLQGKNKIPTNTHSNLSQNHTSAGTIPHKKKSIRKFVCTAVLCFEINAL